MICCDILGLLHVISHVDMFIVKTGRGMFDWAF